MIDLHELLEWIVFFDSGLQLVNVLLAKLAIVLEDRGLDLGHIEFCKEFVCELCYFRIQVFSLT